MNEPTIIYPAPYYPMYRAQLTVGGWVVVYLADRYNCRNVDGGKLHKSRQNAYAKAKRLNDSIPSEYLNWYYVDQRDGTYGGYAQAFSKADAIKEFVQSCGKPYKTWRIKELVQAPEPEYP